MDYLIDTSVAIQMRDGDASVLAEIEALEGPLLLSAISWVELESGVYRFPTDTEQRRARLDIMLPVFRILAFEDSAVEAYRRILEVVGYSRRKLLDRMIAAQALVLDATLVTRNGDDFRDVPGLAMLEW